MSKEHTCVTCGHVGPHNETAYQKWCIEPMTTSCVHSFGATHGAVGHVHVSPGGLTAQYMTIVAVDWQQVGDKWACCACCAGQIPR